MVLRKKQSYGEAEQSANPPPRQSPPQEPPAGGVRLQRTRSRGEGSMVLRRTVRRRRRWSEALARGGPSIPLPSTRKKRSRQP